MFIKRFISPALAAALGFAWVLPLSSGSPSGYGKKSPCGHGREAVHPQCCVWYSVLEDVQEKLFDGSECGEEAHESLRLTFHDAIAWSPKLGGGGADGSIMAHPLELTYPANDGLQEIIEAERQIALKHKVSFGDIIQFAGAVAVSNCAAGPRLEFLAGRSNMSHPAPDRLVPEPSDSVDKILERMDDAGFCAEELVALLASHSVGAQDLLQPELAGSPFDSTPSNFDTQFYLETMTSDPPAGVFRMESDFRLARDKRTVCEWQSFIDDHTSMVNKFAAAYSRLAIVGQDRASLIDCSAVIPMPKKVKIKPPTYPFGNSRKNIKVTCPGTPFPSVAAHHGPNTAVPPVPRS